MHSNTQQTINACSIDGQGSWCSSTAPGRRHDMITDSKQGQQAECSKVSGIQKGLVEACRHDTGASISLTSLIYGPPCLGLSLHKCRHVQAHNPSLGAVPQPGGQVKSGMCCAALQPAAGMACLQKLQHNPCVWKLVHQTLSQHSMMVPPVAEARQQHMPSPLYSKLKPWHL